MKLFAILTVLDRDKSDTFESICDSLELPLTVSMLGYGTAKNEMLEKYGLSETEKSVFLTTATSDGAERLIKSAKRRLMVDIPGNGIMITLPLKSVGGGKTLAYLSNNAKPDGKNPDMSFDHELLIVILNQSYMYDVMEAARGAGATGGTVLHGKGIGKTNAKHFLGVSLATEKEVILITVKSEDKAAVMKAVAELTGPHTPAGAISFSLPVSDVAGLRSGE